MANDPEFAKEIEWNLSGEVAANSLLYSWAKRDGVELGGPTVKYDANGNREASCGGMRTANAGNGNNSSKIQKKYKEDQERWMKARKKREEKAEPVLKKSAEKSKSFKNVWKKCEVKGRLIWSVSTMLTVAWGLIKVLNYHRLYRFLMKMRKE